MRINSIQNYNNYNQNSKTHKNQSFGNVTITKKTLYEVKNLLNDKETFDRYCRHITYLNQFQLNLKEIMKDVKICDFLKFNESFKRLDIKQINNLGQEVIQSFLDILGEEKTKDFRLEIRPNPQKLYYNDVSDNEFIGTGILCSSGIYYYVDKKEITPEMIEDDTIFAPWSNYLAITYPYWEPNCCDRMNNFRLPLGEEELQTVVRGIIIKNLRYVINNRLKEMEDQIKQDNKKAEADKISNVINELR